MIAPSRSTRQSSRASKTSRVVRTPHSARGSIAWNGTEGESRSGNPAAIYSNFSLPLDGGPEIAENSRDQFRDGRVDRHRPLQDRIGRSSIHHVQDTVDRLITTHPQYRGPKDSLRLSVGDHLHEPLGFALLDRPPDPRHRTLRYEQRPARPARFGFGQPDAPERWINVEGIGGNTLAHSTVFTIEKIGRDDLIVVVGGVGEGAAAVAVAQGPDAGHIGGQAVVHPNVAPCIDRDSGLRGRDRPCWAGAPPPAAHAIRPRTAPRT